MIKIYLNLTKKIVNGSVDESHDVQHHSHKLLNQFGSSQPL